MVSSSNIRVSVKFAQPAVFAGEDVECVITLTNCAYDSHSYNSNHSRPQSSPRGSANSAQRTQPSEARHAQGKTRSNGARSSRAGLTPRSPTLSTQSTFTGSARATHERSISIISIKSDGDAANGDDDDGTGSTKARKSRPGHRRGNSVQGDVSQERTARPGQKKRSSLSSRQDIPTVVQPNGTQLSSRRIPEIPSLKRANSKKDTAGHAIASPRQLKPDFKFPATLSPSSPTAGSQEEEHAAGMSSAGSEISRAQSPQLDTVTESPFNPIARLLSAASLNGTPRSSIDLQSEGNRSDETLASEYPTQQFSRLPGRGAANRPTSKLPDVMEHAEPEHLMMGYAQVSGSFVLDGSLVNQNPFEDVKRRSVVGGQGAGGVIGVERKKRDSGLFAGLGWSAIGDSLGNLLGAGEMSSIKEMRNTANSRAIPILSTPQSILFVDMKLAPGESQQYSYSLTLPRGLPPSHKGRAIKITYMLQIGLQRPGSKAGVSVIEVPFRVFSTVNARGEVLFHDLLSPHVSLKDLARTSVGPPKKAIEMSTHSDLSSFLAYAQTLLDTDTSSFGLLSPTIPQTPSMRRKSSVVQMTSSKEAIDLAVMRSNQPQQSNLSTKYSIARSSRPVATLMLPRSAYRLGETVHLIMDLRSSKPDLTPKIPKEDDTNALDTLSLPESIPVYAVLVTLETHETVDPTLAMRSPQSIYRYTRKIHAQAGEKALFSRRLCFALAIPPSATAEFGTTGVGLEWRIRVEFMTPILKAQTPNEDHEVVAEEGEGEDDDQEVRLVPEEADEQEWPDLLEEMASDDRGQVLQGIEQLYVDTFEVAVPVRVYGAVVGSGNDNDTIDIAI